MPSLLHLADVHLGARHADMGAAAVQQRERQLAAFVRAIDVGLRERVDAALICGDLFDSNAQPRRSVERAASELRRLCDSGVHVVIIPGTHDAYDSHSIYRTFDLARLAGQPASGGRLTVLTPERPELLIRELDLMVYGRVFATKRAPHSPLADFDVSADGRATWKVGMIHGSRFIAGLVERDDVLFRDEEIAASGLDYLALGHWHSFLSGRCGATTWAYPGAPEPVAVDQDGAGFVCLVRLEDGASGGRSVHLERERVGRTAFRSLEVDAAELTGQDDLERRVREQADPDLVLAVSVVGIAHDSLEISTDEVERALAGSFLHLRVSDRSAVELAEGPELPLDTVAGRFVADAQARIAEAEARADPEAADLERQVLRLGRRLLLDDPDHVTLA
jgi:DNA repair exonuclease SbcCD nuclease subunit